MRVANTNSYIFAVWVVNGELEIESTLFFLSALRTLGKEGKGPKINMAQYLGLVRCQQTKQTITLRKQRCGVAVDCRM